MRGGICGVMGDKYIRSQNESYSQGSICEPASQIHEVVSPMAKHDQRSLWYIDANNLYGYALMKKLPYKDFEYSNTTLDKVLNTSDDSDYGYWLEYEYPIHYRMLKFVVKMGIKVTKVHRII